LEILVLRHYYTTLAACSSYKRRVSWLEGEYDAVAASFINEYDILHFTFIGFIPFQSVSVFGRTQNRHMQAMLPIIHSSLAHCRLLSRTNR
jgi:hypothetical protein